MATGDQADIQTRLQSVVPPSWFGPDHPNETATLSGFASIASWVYGLIAFAKLQMRRLTASGIFLDLYAYDYLGLTLQRRKGEQDDSWRPRIGKEILRERVTRAGVQQAVADLTGKTPVMFEPWNTGDTGAWSSRTTQTWGRMAWASRTAGLKGQGLWGSRNMSNVAFITAYRPGVFNVPNIGGWASRTAPKAWSLGGWSFRFGTATSSIGSFAFITKTQAAGTISDQDIYDTINANKPTGVTVVALLTSTTANPVTQWTTSMTVQGAPSLSMAGLTKVTEAILVPVPSLLNLTSVRLRTGSSPNSNISIFNVPASGAVTTTAAGSVTVTP